MTTHQRFVFEMPADSAVAFDAFHHRHWRARWDTLVGESGVEGGAPCPFVGALTWNRGRGLLRGIVMRTRFVSFQRPRLAAAAMEGRAFPFTRWAASMRHEPAGEGRSRLVYTVTFDVPGGPLGAPLGGFVARAFARQTQRRFAALAAFLAGHAAEVQAWQRAAGAQSATGASPSSSRS